MIEEAIEELTPTVGVRSACAALGESRARDYRRHRKSPAPPKPDRVATPQPRALSEVERKEIRRVLNSAEHADEAPATVYAKLLDEGVYLGSVSTMYRVLREHDEVGDRRRHATHPARVKPELVATKPNEVYSWDITKLHGPAKWTYYYLYSIIDIYSGYVPGWMLARAERASLAEALMAETIDKQGIGAGELTIHSDRGSPMIAKPVAHLLADLGVTKSHSRPHTSNDNPYSESHFRTLKYRPDFPRPSGPSRTPTTTVDGSSLGTTRTTGIRVSGFTPQPTSTTDEPSWSEHSAGRYSTSLTPPTRNASSARPPDLRNYRPWRGSTDPRREQRRHSDCPNFLSKRLTGAGSRGSWVVPSAMKRSSMRWGARNGMNRPPTSWVAATKHQDN